jgi:chemotaxis protein CheD
VQIYLKAGEIVISQDPSVVLTVLGSCLSVTMFHRRSGIGAICHSLLPQCAEAARCSRECSEPGKYVECSVRTLVKRFHQIGISSRELEVKVFGGADMFGPKSPLQGMISVGKQNVAIALQVMEKEGLSILSMDVGGIQGRKLFFHTHAGDVFLKRLSPRIILAGNGAGP